MESNIEHTGWEPRLVWRSREEGPGGQQWDTYQVPGPAWGTDWDIETRKTGSLSSGGTRLCVCVFVCVCEV